MRLKCDHQPPVERGARSGQHRGDFRRVMSVVVNHGDTADLAIPLEPPLGGGFDYDFGDTAGMTPLLPMYTLGHEFVPPPIHAGGLRYHGDAPIISNLVKNGRMEAVAYPQGKVFEAAVQYARTQGTIPAPETSHAIRAVVDEALAAKEEGTEKVILFSYSGHGLLDLGAYDDYLNGRLDATT